MVNKKYKIEAGTKIAPETLVIKISSEGPYLVYGSPEIAQEVIHPNKEGDSWTYAKGATFKTGDEPCMLCRCGASANKPYCDQSHLTADWDPRETAGFVPLLEEAEELEGPRLALTDNEKYCAYLRFCDACGRIWNLVQVAESEEEIELVKREAAHCVSGRLVVWDKKTGMPHEQEFVPSIGLIQDPALQISGPLWVKGGIRIESSNGKSYEVRNRVTLCRCGQSGNKPFCDGSHASIKFTDDLPMSSNGEEW